MFFTALVPIDFSKMADGDSSLGQTSENEHDPSAIDADAEDDIAVNET